MQNLALIIMISLLVGCRSTFKVETLSVRDAKTIESQKRESRDFKNILNEEILNAYRKAKSPSFALIHGFYKLPAEKPFGSAIIISGQNYHSQISAIKITDPEHDYAVEPIYGDDAVALEDAINALLANGVTLKDISMTDAVAIAKAEEKAGTKFSFGKNQSLLPNVTYLISIYRTQSKTGPVLIGRVIKNDGTLAAFRVFSHSVTTNAISDLIVTLFADTIRHGEVSGK